MSLDLMVRIYYKHPPLTEAEIFQKMVRGVELWGQKIDSWRTFQVTNPKHRRGYKSHHGDFTEEQILYFSKKHKHAHSNYHASLPVSCWRWNSAKASMLSEHVYLDVNTWDQLRMPPFLTSREIDGYAEININPAHPYGDKSGPISPELSEYNLRVEENVSRLQDLILILAQSLNPTSIKVFLDKGLCLPWNSHCTFYSNFEAVLSDLYHMKQLWEVGIPGHNGMPPLCEYRSDQERRHEFALSELRTLQGRLKMWNQLNGLLEFVDEVTEEIAEEIWHDPAINMYSYEFGRLLLGDPNFLTSFVDPFYVDLLERAKHRMLE